MTATKALRIYLDDHLAGASSGARLARRLASASEATASGPELRALAVNVEGDRRTLIEVRAALGMRRRTAKELGGLASEQLSRLKLSPLGSGDPGAARLLELETLSLGILGKRALWRALEAGLGADRPGGIGLGGFDFAALGARAEAQWAVVERHRLGRAAAALTAS